jgi:TRAP-type C4-dicarboxylate transport system permease small subunit
MAENPPAQHESRLVGWLRDGLQAISVAILAFYVALVLLQVFFRYVLNQSLFWSEELVRYALLWGVMLTCGLVSYNRSHIKIDALARMLPAPLGRAVNGLVDLLCIGFYVVLMWQGYLFVQRTSFQTSAVLQLPMIYVYSAMPVGAAVMTLFTVLAWRRERRARAAIQEPLL